MLGGAAVCERGADVCRGAAVQQGAVVCVGTVVGGEPQCGGGKPPWAREPQSVWGNRCVGEPLCGEELPWDWGAAVCGGAAVWRVGDALCRGSRRM